MTHILKSEIFNAFNILTSLIIILLFKTINGDLPADFQKCHPGDVQCIPNAIMTLMKRFPKGNPDFGMKPVDEIILNNVWVSKAHEDRAVQLNLKFNEMKLYNLPDLNITRVVGFEKNAKKSKFEVYGIIPNLIIKGDYIARGKVLLLPLNGNGNVDLALKNVNFGLKAKVTDALNPIDGKHYITLNKMKFNMEPEGFAIEMENLFDGNKELSESLNKIINENWQDIWTELATGINSAVAGIVKDLFSTISTKLAYDDFYITESNNNNNN